MIDKQLIESKDRQRMALEVQAHAMEILLTVQNKRINDLSKRDSVLLERVVINGDAIRKFKFNNDKNEDRKSFNNYGPSEWASYFAGL